MKHGLKQVDALEPSTGMSDVAKSKDVYRNYFHTYFTDNVPVFESGITYFKWVQLGTTWTRNTVFDVILIWRF